MSRLPPDSKCWDIFSLQTVQYHTMRNVLFMAMTEFEKVIHLIEYLVLLSTLCIYLHRSCWWLFPFALKLTEEPDWTFISARQGEIALLFGVDDHWGPLSHLEEVDRSFVIPIALYYRVCES